MRSHHSAHNYIGTRISCCIETLFACEQARLALRGRFRTYARGHKFRFRTYAQQTVPSHRRGNLGAFAPPAAHSQQYIMLMSADWSERVARICNADSTREQNAIGLGISSEPELVPAPLALCRLPMLSLHALSADFAQTYSVLTICVREWCENACELCRTATLRI